MKDVPMVKISANSSHICERKGPGQNFKQIRPHFSGLHPKNRPEEA